jgi:hypothetical protein
MVEHFRLSFLLVALALTVAAPNSACTHGEAQQVPTMQQMPTPMPSSAAFSACNGHRAGDACSYMETDGRRVSGTCRNGPDGQGPLACAPAQMTTATTLAGTQD